MPTFLIGTPLLSLFAVTLVTFVLIYTQKQRKSREEKQALSIQLLQTRAEVTEEAFKKISLELHDNILQSLSFINTELFSIAEKEGGSIIGAHTESLGLRLEETRTEIRNLSHNLNSTFLLKLRLDEALKKELKYIEKSKKIKCRCTTHGNNNLDPEKEIIIFRVAQEALQNIIKHAQATSVNVILKYGSERFHITVEDNGIGFEPTEGTNGIGFINIEERVRLLKGNMTVLSQKEQGSTIQIECKL